MALSDEEARAFGRRVKRLRQERGWSQEELAFRAARARGHSGGFNRSTVKHYEAGERREMDADIVLGVARVLETTVEYLLTGLDPAQVTREAQDGGSGTDCAESSVLLAATHRAAVAIGQAYAATQGKGQAWQAAVRALAAIVEAAAVMRD